MNITLKNLKYAEFASEETHCFEATVYVDGKSVGRVSNDGRGGCNTYDFDARELSEHIKAANIQVESFGMKLTKDLDWVITDLVNDSLTIKDAKAFRNKVAKKSGFKSDQVRIFIHGDQLVARGINDKSDDEVATEIGEGARRIDNAVPVFAI